MHTMREANGNDIRYSLNRWRTGCNDKGQKMEHTVYAPVMCANAALTALRCASSYGY